MAKGTCIPVQLACLSNAVVSRLGTICHTYYCQFTPREAPGACEPEMMTQMKSRADLLDIADWGKRVPICHQEKGQYTVGGSPMSEGKSQALLTLSERSTAFYQLLLPKHARLNGRLPTNSFEEIERSALFHFSYVLSSSRLTWSLLHVKVGSIVCNHEKCVTKHIFHIFFLPQAPLLTKLWCSRFRAARTGYDVTHPGSCLLSVWVLWVMAGVPSCLGYQPTTGMMRIPFGTLWGGR